MCEFSRMAVQSPEAYRTFPALYWVTLCWVCFLQSLPLQ
jgi:hypothetical protein